MSTIDLYKHGGWTLDTTPDHDGELALEYDREYSSAVAAYLDMATLRTVRDVIDNAISQCPCDYETVQRICDEFPAYHLGAIDPACPFHGES